MRRAALFVLLVSIASILLLQTVSAGEVQGGCCVIQNDDCTYWDMSGWGQQAKGFCNKISLQGYVLSTKWADQTCNDALANQTFMAQLPAQCSNGFDIPEFNAITAGIALAASGIGFIFLRKKR